METAEREPAYEARRDPLLRTYLDTWAQAEGLYSGQRIIDGIQARFQPQLLANTPYFFTPGEGLGSNTFGVINASTGERTVQVSLKLIF